MVKNRLSSSLKSRFSNVFLLLAIAVIFALSGVEGTTEPSDVQALQVLYTSLNSPSQLTGWKSTGGDPCGESWRGITCQGSAVVSMDISVNNFSGDLPNSFSSLLNLSTLPAPPPPPYTAPPPGRSRNNRTQSPPGSRTPQGSNDPNNRNIKKGLTTAAIIGIILGSLLVAIFALLVLVFCLRKGKKKKSNRRSSTGSLPVTTDKVNTELQEQRVKHTASVADLQPPPAENITSERIHGRNGSARRVKSPITATSYTVAALQTATNSFSQENLIGEGSVGRVYRAEFPNGKIMAIKKIDNAALSLQEEDNFLEAVSNMSRLRHPNIISLAGYCAEHGQRLLVHDYVGNGSLQDMLHFADDRSNTLTWNARVRVALGTARALEYLHEVCLPSVVHRNFKSANILLDEELNPHLSDCGLASLTPNTERQVSSTQMVGSFGYSAPEFALSGIYTVKSDVYSFGVVMLELLTGRKPLDSSRARSEQSLVRWATPQLHDIDALAKMVDPTLNGMYPAKSLSRFADIIALCVQPEPEFRPPMSEVVQALVRLMQRASVVKRRSSDESGFGYKTPDMEAYEMSY
ncbi:hypothetical protein LguiB_005201 [Lonicera macranthoides]